MTLEELQTEFLFNLREYFDEHIEDDCKEFIHELDEAFAAVKEFQTKEAAIPVSQVCICFLNTSYYFNKPKLRVLLYEPDCIWKDAVFHKDIDAQWLVSPLESYKKDIEMYAIKEHKSLEWQQLELRHMLKLLLMMARYYLKYEIRELCLNGHVKDIFKDEFFGVSFGEYMDWQFPIYCESQEIDLLQTQSSDNLRFKHFENKVYRKIEVAQRDVSSGVFKDCEFTKCNFKEMNFNDVMFINCKFKNVVFDKGTMYGTTFETCEFENTQFVNISIEQNEDEVLKNGFYRLISFVDCEGGEDGVFFVDHQ